MSLMSVLARTMRQRTGRGAAALTVLLGAAGCASAAYQALAERRDRRRIPPPGELVGVGRRRLHIWRTGPVTGAPTVVAIPALAGASTHWVRLQRAVDPQLPLVLYDRGGVGWSEPGRLPRTATVMADELHELLQAAGIRGPYVLAGNSTGGLIARMYTARYPDEVAGLVLVDSSHPEMLERLHEAGERRLLWSFYGRGLRRLLTWNGVRRARFRFGLGPDLLQEARRDHPDDLTAAVVAEELNTRYTRAAAFELLSAPTLLRQVRDQTGHLGSLPLTVITAGDPERSARPRHVWLELQDELAALSTDSTHLLAERAGHFVQADDPEFVAAALRRMVDQISESSPSYKRGI